MDIARIQTMVMHMLECTIKECLMKRLEEFVKMTRIALLTLTLWIIRMIQTMSTQLFIAQAYVQMIVRIRNGKITLS